jgi:formylglycine-generating enzyme
MTPDCRGARACFYALFIPSVVGSMWACGARTGLGLIDDLGGSALGDSGTEPPSCAEGDAGTTNCGPTGESCCTSLPVSGGTFYRTYDYPDGGSGPNGEADPATVSNFRLDKYLATVGRFRQFVTAWNGGAGYLPAAGSGKHAYLNGGRGLENGGAPGTYETGWLASYDAEVTPTDEYLTCGPPFGNPRSCCYPSAGGMGPGDTTWTPEPGDNENLPIVCPNWYEAYAFCIWDGGFLPTEAEWEYAGAGGSEQRQYPWGETGPGTQNLYAIYGCYYPTMYAVGPTGARCSPSPVGWAGRGQGLWGQLDMVGQVDNWLLDLWDPHYVEPWVDSAYLTATSETGLSSSRVTRGGGAGAEECTLTVGSGCYHRLPVASAYHGSAFGFRCARAP